MTSRTETILRGISAHMLIGYMRISTDGDRQILDLPHRRLCLVARRPGDGKP
jgi:hypothetical protein